MSKTLDRSYWENRYENAHTGWNIGYPSPPITSYADQLASKSIDLLIPGAGNAYEAEYLWQQGFENVFVLDIAKQPLEALKQRVPDFPEAQLLHQDFFELDQRFDLIFEQTFFCALPPEKRPTYVQQMAQLLKPSGRLVGLLFDFPLTEEGPPFGGNAIAYEAAFSPYFHIKCLERSFNSIKPRQDKELFFIFEKK